jgi:hypothetical protein
MAEVKCEIISIPHSWSEDRHLKIIPFTELHTALPRPYYLHLCATICTLIRFPHCHVQTNILFLCLQITAPSCSWHPASRLHWMLLAHILTSEKQRILVKCFIKKFLWILKLSLMNLAVLTIWHKLTFGMSNTRTRLLTSCSHPNTCVLPRVNLWLQIFSVQISEFFSTSVSQFHT